LLRELNEVLLKQGDYVVLPNWSRGFVTGAASTASYNVMQLSEDGKKWVTQPWPANLISLSGIEPTEAECIAWAKWMLR
jgi:hypothetical protein